MIPEEIIDFIEKEVDKKISLITEHFEDEINQLKRTIEVQSTEIKILKEGDNL